MTLPRIEFSFFNPVSRSYQVLYSPESSIRVEPSDQVFELPKSISEQAAFKKDLQLEGRDIHFIEERLPDLTLPHALGWLEKLLALADLLLLLAVIFGFFRKRQESLFAKNTALKRRHHARSLAESRMKNLKSLAASKDPQAVSDYFEEVEKILTQYLTDKFNLSPYGITRSDLERQLESALGGSDPLFQEILELYRNCETARFAKGSIPEGSKQKAMKVLKDAVARMEKKHL